MIIGQILKLKPRSVITARPEDTIHDIASKLGQKKIGAIVIIGEAGRVVGIISERDIIRLVGEHGGKALALKVSEGMTRDVITCSKDATLEDIMEMMTKGRFRHMPVLEGESLIGIISIGDVVKHHISEVELECSAMKDYLATG